MARRGWSVWCGAASLLMAVSVSAQTAEVGPPPLPPGVDVGALQAQYERERERATALLAVESDPAGFAAQLAAKWAPLVQERGITTEELASVGRLVSADRLLAASHATTYEGVVSALFGTGGGDPTPRTLGQDNSDLVFFPLEPCRLFDTRFAAAGILAADTFRTFAVNGPLTAQGGNPAGCGVPVDPAAIVVTLTITQPQGFGDLRAFAFGSPAPVASVLNYQSGQLSLANTTVVPVCQICGTGLDINVQADVAGTHVIGDVVGYFWSPFATALDVTLHSSSNPVAAAPANVTLFSPVCPAGRVAVGGGPTSNSTLVFVTASEPSSTTQWACSGHNTGVAATFFCSVTCARTPGR